MDNCTTAFEISTFSPLLFLQKDEKGWGKTEMKAQYSCSDFKNSQCGGVKACVRPMWTEFSLSEHFFSPHDLSARVLLCHLQETWADKNWRKNEKFLPEKKKRMIQVDKILNFMVKSICSWVFVNQLILGNLTYQSAPKMYFHNTHSDQSWEQETTTVMTVASLHLCEVRWTPCFQGHLCIPVCLAPQNIAT